MNAQASIVIPTHDRIGELRQLLRSALAQTVPVEILVMDDGSSGATGEMIRNEFPQIRYFHLGSECGPAFQRNRGIEIASNNIVFPLDDDVLFSSPRTVEQTVAEFGHPRVGAIGIPFINVGYDHIVRQRAPEAHAIYLAHAFVGAAHAIRRDVFLKLGGYREHFFYMGEEGDLCIRMMKIGYVVRLGGADPIHHLESRRRDLARAGFSGRRNDILFAWHNLPLRYLPIHLIGTTINGIRSALTQGRFRAMLLGTISGYIGCWKHRHERTPLPAAIYRLHRRLKKTGPAKLEEVEPLLPTLSV